MIEQKDFYMVAGRTGCATRLLNHARRRFAEVRAEKTMQKLFALQGTQIRPTPTAYPTTQITRFTQEKR